MSSTETNPAVVDGEPQAIAPAGAYQYLDEERKELLRNTICQGATDAEFEMAVATANRLRLDPFTRQIHFVKRWDKKLRREVMATQVAIDGFRLIAERTGKYRGQTEPEWCGPDGVWRTVWLDNKPPSAARCGVYRSDMDRPLYAVARFSSYVQTYKDGNPTPFWAKMSDVMIHKCAEALALRKAFPSELSGVYSSDEMAQADSEGDYRPPVEARRPQQPREALPPASKEDRDQLAKFLERIKGVGSEDELKELAPMAANLAEAVKGPARKAWADKVNELNRRPQARQGEPPRDPGTGEVIDAEEPPPPGDGDQGAFGFDGPGE